MAAVDVPVRVDRHVAGVGVLADDDVAAGVAQHLQPLGHRRGIARGLDDDVGAAAARAVAHPGDAIRRVRRAAVMSSVSSTPEPPRRFEPRRRRADDEDAQRAGELREDRRVQADGPAALHDDRVAEGDARALDGMEAGRQAAAATHEVERVEPVGQRQDADARLDLDPLGPAAEQPVLGRGRDAVDPSVRAARRWPSPRGSASSFRRSRRRRRR